MKKIYSFISAITVSLNVLAQAPIPTSYDFENGGTYPTGWTLNPVGSGTQYYTTSFACGGSAYSLKFDQASSSLGYENLVINVASQPGLISYNIRGNTGTSSLWSGTFDIQESITGAVGTYTTFMSHTASSNTISSSACSTKTAMPTNPNSRYIRFYYASKTTGNICLDDITIATPLVPVGIKVLQGSTQISNGGFINPIGSPVSSTIQLPLTLENIGISSTLSVTAASISGLNAADFVTTTTLPLSINAGTNLPLNIDFTPSAAGTRTAEITLTTNDPNNSTYIIKLYGVGGLYATTPSTQATNLTFPSVKTFSLLGQFNPGINVVDELGGFLILRNNNGSVTDVPVSGTVYQRGEYIGASQVVYSGPINVATYTFAPTFIRASKTYGFSIYAYNGSGVYTSYNTTAPLSQTVTTPYSMMAANEYSGLSTSNTNFLTSLSAQINPHTSIFYANYTPTMIDKFETRDTLITSPVVFTKVITCAYSSLNRPYNDPFDYTGLDWSREHTYCHNWMPTNPADNPEKPEYNDQHNLYPAKQTNVNGIRSNNPLGEVVGTPLSSYLSCKIGDDINGNKVFEPRDQHKGNAARAIMYMATAYNGISGNNWKLRNPISTSINYGQDQNILKKWHFQDLPDSYERSRNDFVESLQGNRNPFIDSVNYACYIDFSNMTYIANPTYTTSGASTPCYVAVGIKENVATHFEYVLAPNPTSGEFYLLIDAKVAEKFNLTMTDVTGRTVYSKQLDIVNGFNNVTINDLKLQGGVYFVSLNYKNEKVTRRLIIQ